MLAFTLPEPTALERAIKKRLAHRSCTEHWIKYANAEETVIITPSRIREAAVVIGRTAPPTENIFRLLLLIDAVKNSGAQKIGVVVPYLGYSRQDRRSAAGSGVAALMLVRLLKAAGASWLLTADLHSRYLMDTRVLPVKNVSLLTAMAKLIKKERAGDVLTVVSPDHGGLARARAFAQVLGGTTAVAWCEKVRQKDSRISMRTLHGKIAGERAVIVDDIIDTGRTVAAAVALLRAHGLRRFSLCATHPLFTQDAASRIAALNFEQIIVSNTIPLPGAARRLKNLQIMDTTNFFLKLRL